MKTISFKLNLLTVRVSYTVSHKGHVFLCPNSKRELVSLYSSLDYSSRISLVNLLRCYISEWNTLSTSVVTSYFSKWKKEYVGVSTIDTNIEDSVKAKEDCDVIKTLKAQATDLQTQLDKVLKAIDLLSN